MSTVPSPPETTQPAPAAQPKPDDNAAEKAKEKVVEKSPEEQEAERHGWSFVPNIFGESNYDRVTSMMMAIVVGFGIVVGWLFLILPRRISAYAGRVTAKLDIVDVFGGGGGSPDGTPGSTEKIDVPGAEASAQASNNGRGRRRLRGALRAGERACDARCRRGCRPEHGRGGHGIRDADGRRGRLGPAVVEDRHRRARTRIWSRRWRCSQPPALEYRLQPRPDAR